MSRDSKGRSESIAREKPSSNLGARSNGNLLIVDGAGGVETTYNSYRVFLRITTLECETFLYRNRCLEFKSPCRELLSNWLKGNGTIWKVCCLQQMEVESFS